MYNWSQPICPQQDFVKAALQQRKVPRTRLSHFLRFLGCLRAPELRESPHAKCLHAHNLSVCSSALLDTAVPKAQYSSPHAVANVNEWLVHGNWCHMDDEDFQIDLGFDDEPEAEAVEDVKAEPQDEQQQLAKPEVKDDVDGLKKVQGGNENRPRREQIGTVVHVTDMSWYTTDIEVEAACGVYGTVKNVKFFEDRSNGRSMGACAVEFNTMEEAKACIAGLDGKSIGQDTVLVDWPGKRPPFKQRHGDGATGNGAANQGMGMDPSMAQMGPMGGPMMGPMGMPRGPMMGPMGPMGPLGGNMMPMGRGHMGRGPGMGMRPMRGRGMAPRGRG